MKTKLLILTAIAALGVTTPAFAKHRVVQTRNGRAVVVNTHRHDSRSSQVFWNVGIGFPFYGGYYGGYPYYGGYSSGYPYYGSSYYYGGYPYGYGSYPNGYNNSYYGSGYPYSYNRYSYRNYNDSVVIRVQERLARAGYYRGSIDGVIGPRTQYAIRAYERSRGLPADGIIDNRLLRTMGLA
jgi:Putative peptidoglycan binding domain